MTWGFSKSFLGYLWWTRWTSNDILLVLVEVETRLVTPGQSAALQHLTPDTCSTVGGGGGEGVQQCTGWWSDDGGAGDTVQCDDGHLRVARHCDDWLVIEREFPRGWQTKLTISAQADTVTPRPRSSIWHLTFDNAGPRQRSIVKSREEWGKLQYFVAMSYKSLSCPCVGCGWLVQLNTKIRFNIPENAKK